MPTIPHTGFYVYTLARPDGLVFYVGKGSRQRIADHEAEARRGHRCLKCAIIRSIWKSGGSVVRVKVFETADERKAYHQEEQTLYTLRQAQNWQGLCNLWMGRVPLSKHKTLVGYDRFVLAWFAIRMESMIRTIENADQEWERLYGQQATH